jgi:hypothetical protein
MARRLKRRQKRTPPATDLIALVLRILHDVRDAAGLSGDAPAFGPQTTLSHLTRSMEEHLASASPPQLLDGARRLAQAHGGFAGIVDSVRRDRAKDRQAFASDAIGAKILDIYDQSAGVSPLVRGAVVLGSPKTDVLDSVDFWGRIAETRQLSDELRAIALLEVIAAMVEGPYARYLRTLWCLVRLADGKFPPPPDSIGMMVNYLAPRFAAVPGMVDPDAAHVRNAVSHRNKKYDPGSGNILVWERPAKRAVNGATWSREFSIEALEAKLGQLVQATGERLARLRAIEGHEWLLRLADRLDAGLVDAALEGSPSAIAQLLEWRPEFDAVERHLEQVPHPAEWWFVDRPAPGR